MKLRYEDSSTKALLELSHNEPSHLHRRAFQRDESAPQYVIIWNQGEDQTLIVDGIHYKFCRQTLVALDIFNAFSLERADDVTLWQYNRNFYCISDHDHEVSCIGLLFYGASEIMLLSADDEDVRRLNLLREVFEDEFRTRDNIQGEMLRALLKRLIIMLTRMAKSQYVVHTALSGGDLDLVRQFNVLVEQHFRTYHDVAKYAAMMNKSPKTLSNFFALYNAKTPSEVIHDRINLEARRLLLYTEKSIKEIGYELGFEEHTHFSQFFRKRNLQSPSDFRASQSHRRATPNAL